MRLATVQQAQQIDQLSKSEYHLTDEILMESAGSSAAREIIQAYLPELANNTIGIVCGPGNNGGDGLVVARHLHSAGYHQMQVFVAADKANVTDLYRVQLRRVQAQGIPIHYVHENSEQWERLRGCAVIVDALFGIGLNRDVSAPYSQLIELINSCRRPVVSLDIPSGLDGNRGVALGVCVQAAMTITFGLSKPGFYIAEGPQNIGKLVVVPIGFPYELFRRVATTHFAFGERLARRYLPRRKEESHKGDHGHLLIAAGSSGTWGAAVLSSQAGYRIGAGYVTLASFEDNTAIVAQSPEILTARADDPSTWSEKKPTAYAIGPGLGVGEKTAQLLHSLREHGVGSVVVDADAITTCFEYDLFPLPASWVITPHAGELARVLKVDTREINSDRYAFALRAAKQLGCHVLLKGFRSILAYEDRCMVITAGNSALAKAGSGDVLTGMIGGLMAQGVQSTQACATAAYIHGRMADEWIRFGNDKNALLPSDLNEQLPSLMGRIRGGTLF